MNNEYVTSFIDAENCQSRKDGCNVESSMELGSIL